MQIASNSKFKNIMNSQRTKTGLLLAACFVLPCVILLAVFVSYGFAPFGDKSLMIMDMSGQYSEFFCGLKNISAENGGILFSWSKALGGNYAGVFAYYVASPLSFITLFFPNEYMHMPQARPGHLPRLPAKAGRSRRKLPLYGRRRQSGAGSRQSLGHAGRPGHLVPPVGL